MMQRKLRLLALLFFIVGVLLTANGGYIHAKAWVAQLLLQQAWDKTIAGSQKVKPWPWADTWPVARLMIPEKDIDLIVLEGDSGSVLAFGPGRMSASRTIGSDGNAVISGHKDTSFEFLKDICIGDALYLQTPEGRTRRYRIYDFCVKKADEIRLTLASAQPVLTLITCWPFDGLAGSSERLLVFAEQQES